MSDEPTTDPVADELTVDVAAVSDGAYTLLVADFNDTDAAWEAYELLKSLEDGRHIELESVVVVKRGDDGQLEIQKATDHSTRRGLGWGLVGGVVLGVIFPPSIIGSAVVLGAAGAATGKLRELHVDVGIDYTDTGRLVGHIVHTDRMVTAAIAQADGFPEELADRLCHVLLSHHGQKEYGAPIVPMTPEACALHYADNLDAHVQYFQQVIDQGAGSGNHWSEYQRLFDRYIYIGPSGDAND